LADTDFRGEMDDAVDVLEAAPDHIFVADVADDQFGVGRKVLGAFTITVNLLDQAVEDANPIAAPKKLADDRPADESSTTCD